MSKIRRTSLILAVIIAFHAVRLFAWEWRNTLPHGLDEMDVANSVVRWQVLLGQQESFGRTLWYFFVSDSKYSPLFCQLSWLMSRLVGPGWPAMHLVTNLLFLLLVFGVFLLGRSLAGDLAGLLAAFLVGCYPLVFNFAHTANTNMVSAAFEVLAFTFLIRSAALTRRRETWLAIVCVSLALVGERGSPLIMLAAPVALTLGLALFRVRRRRPALLLAFILVPLLVSGPYVMQYVTTHWTHNVDRLTRDYFALKESWLFPDALWAFYLVELPRSEIGGFFTLLLVLVFGKFLRPFNKDKLLVVLALFVPLLVYSSFASRVLSYNFGVLPIVAVITAVGVASLERKWLRGLAVGSVIGMGFLSCLVSVAEVDEGINRTVQQNPLLRAAFVSLWGGYATAPKTGVPLMQAASSLAEKLPPGQLLVVAVPPDWPDQYPWSLMIQVVAMRPDATAILLDDPSPAGAGMTAMVPATPLPEPAMDALRREIQRPFTSFRGSPPPPAVQALLRRARPVPFASQIWEDKQVLLATMK